LQIDVFCGVGFVPYSLRANGVGNNQSHAAVVEALRRRNMPLHSLIFVGEANRDNMRTISDISGSPVLGHVRHLDVMDRTALLRVLAERFRTEDFI
jgi:dethiobiotin synthetase